MSNPSPQLLAASRSTRTESEVRSLREAKREQFHKLSETELRAMGLSEKQIAFEIASMRNAERMCDALDDIFGGMGLRI